MLAFFAQYSVNCTTGHNFGGSKFKFCTYVHTCNICEHRYLLVLTFFGLHMEAISIYIAVVSITL